MKATDSIVVEDGRVMSGPFRGDLFFLSNFYLHPIDGIPNPFDTGNVLFDFVAPLSGVLWKTSEHAYQAAKARLDEEREWIGLAESPNIAKRRGGSVSCRSGWDTVKREVMKHILREKFRDPVLRQRLLATGGMYLVEENTWDDRTWGATRDALGILRGMNMLGEVLMEIREEATGEAKHE